MNPCRLLTLCAIAVALASVAGRGLPPSSRGLDGERPSWSVSPRPRPRTGRLGSFRSPRARRQRSEGDGRLAHEIERSDALIASCEERRRETMLDHFSWSTNATLSQRYYFCAEHYEKGGPVFFYLGNEADVTLYLNNSGLMWESAADFGALLVFAEHRYYGESKPRPRGGSASGGEAALAESPGTVGRLKPSDMGYLTTEQAMADYAGLIWELKAELGEPDAPVIGFGGSYGGMLATWFRLKYPHLLDGAIAGSAPIWTYYGERPAYDDESFAEVVTRDASAEGGSARACAGNVRAAWRALFDLSKEARGRAGLAWAARLCEGAAGALANDTEPVTSNPRSTTDSALTLAYYFSSAWDYLAMGDYPYPSSYMLDGAATLPAYPARAACEFLSDPDLGAASDAEREQNAQSAREAAGGEEAPPARLSRQLALVRALTEAVGVFYNASGVEMCYSAGLAPDDLPPSSFDETEDFWDYQACTEQFMPMGRDGERDMFWSDPFDREAEMTRCRETWGVEPRPLHATLEWGGKDLSSASNIVFSNGLLDPWSSGGVLADLSPSLTAVIIPEGAHHLDLMFSHPLDPPSVVAARDIERANIRLWVDDKRARRGARRDTAAVDA